MLQILFIVSIPDSTCIVLLEVQSMLLQKYAPLLPPARIKNDMLLLISFSLDKPQSLYGLLLTVLAPVWLAVTAGGGPGGASYEGAGSLFSAGLLVGSDLHCEGSTLVAPAGGWYVGGIAALGSYIGGGMFCRPYCPPCGYWL